MDARTERYTGQPNPGANLPLPITGIPTGAVLPLDARERLSQLADGDRATLRSFDRPFTMEEARTKLGTNLADTSLARWLQKLGFVALRRQPYRLPQWVWPEVILREPAEHRLNETAGLDQ